jgi:hypothetical protein
MQLFVVEHGTYDLIKYTVRGRISLRIELNEVGAF